MAFHLPQVTLELGAGRGFQFVSPSRAADISVTAREQVAMDRVTIAPLDDPKLPRRQ